MAFLYIYRLEHIVKSSGAFVGWGYIAKLLQVHTKMVARRRLLNHLPGQINGSQVQKGTAGAGKSSPIRVRVRLFVKKRSRADLPGLDLGAAPNVIWPRYLPAADSQGNRAPSRRFS